MCVSRVTVSLTAFPRKLTKLIGISFKNEFSFINWDFVTLCQSVDGLFLKNISCYLQFTHSA